MTTLGICIPTYKRPEFLGRCVRSALEAAGDCPVRIFIADNSTDDTNAAVYQDILAHSDRITIHRNTTNIGMDNNIQLAVDMCECDYAWIVGDDDYFLPGSVARVHALLQEVQPAFVFANYAFVGDDDGRYLGRALDEPDGTIGNEQFVTRYLWSIGFIGACVVDRKRWDVTTPAPYKDTYYTHVGRICELLSVSKAPVHIVAEPCVANRVEGTDTFTWKRDSYGVFFGFRAMCEAVACQFPDLTNAARQAAKVMEQRYGWLTLRLAMRLRSERGYDVAQYRRYLAPNTTNRIKRLALYFISIAPPGMFRPLVSAYRRVSRGVSA